MQIFNKIKDIQKALTDYRFNGKTVGFVPTMGALHKGHISLIEKAKSDNDITVCSIFVNPTQFNDKNDLAKYPRPIEEDKKILAEAGCQVLFAPSAEEIYPGKDMTADSRQLTETIQLGILDKIMEGKHRPGHFNGVMQIVSKLFDIVMPEKAYFGQKDFQQLAIIKSMVHQLNLPVKIVACPIVRENDGLAMSSRNKLLSEEERKVAPLIYRTLINMKKLSSNHALEELKKFVAAELSKCELIHLDYFEIVDVNTLNIPEHFSEVKESVACIAVKLGNIRLIDNIFLN